MEGWRIPTTIHRTAKISGGGLKFRTRPKSKRYLPSVWSYPFEVLGDIQRHGASRQWVKKSINPHPKKADTTHYRDLLKQNEWLRNNVFDSLGNYLYYLYYLYCAACIRASLGVSKDRLARQCNIKRQQSQQPIVEMPKSEVEEKRLGDHVVMPIGLETSFNTWWRSQDASTIVQVRYPHDRHGNAGKVSNAAKIISAWRIPRLCRP